MGTMKASSFAAPSRRLLLFVLSFSLLPAQAQKQVSLIRIHSGWIGMGTPQDAEVVIRWQKGVFLRDGKPIAAAQVEALVNALEAHRIPKPEMANLGVTLEWLKERLPLVETEMPDTFLDATATQKQLFERSFTDPDRMAKVVPHLFFCCTLDAYPFAEVEIDFEDGSKLSASSHSSNVFMIPWELNGKHEKGTIDDHDGTFYYGTYNAEISRAVSALLPAKSVNKDRLIGEWLETLLAEKLIGQFKDQWNMLGVESRAGDALAVLRASYTVVQADISPDYSEEFGDSGTAKGSHETNLAVNVHKASFPPNLSERLNLLFDRNKVEGLDEFLKTGGKYEALVLSVPWLNDYLREHPNEPAFLFYVHQTSFNDDAMQTFAADMTASGREDLIERVRAQQAQIALVSIQGTDLLIFPDRHTMLWRYIIPSELLKWTAADFPPGQCSGEPQGDGDPWGDGGCSGREITPDGNLADAPAPREQSCMAEHRKNLSALPLSGDELFPVMDHGRGGFIDHTGNVAIPLCFDAVGDFSEGLARFERNKLWGYLDTTGSVVIEPKFSWAKEFSEGLARVMIPRVQIPGGPLDNDDDTWGFIDKTGKVVISRLYQTTAGVKNNIGSDDNRDGFHDGLALFTADYKLEYGFIDKNGKVVIPLRFDFARPFTEGVAAAAVTEKGKINWGYIDGAGTWIISPHFGWAGPFSEGLAAGIDGRDCSYVDHAGKQVLRHLEETDGSPCVGEESSFSEGLAVWKSGKKFGYVDRSGKIVIEARFDKADSFSEGLAAVEIGGKLGFIDKTGKMVIENLVLQHTKRFHHGLAFISTQDGGYGYIDKSGRFVWRPTPLYIQ
jgi:hypothetical protein